MLRAAAGLALTLTLALPQVADACRVLDVQFTPSPDLQIVVWLEDPSGNYVDTLFITQATGRYGLGNRPGIMEFNSEFLWPYGRRESLFPVWSHKRGVTYPKIVFQDGQDQDLSHGFNQCTREHFYCRPLIATESMLQKSIDAQTCATTAYTDKGKFGDATSLYPPRRDAIYDTSNPDTRNNHPDVAQYQTLNDLDAVSRATPAGGAAYEQGFAISTKVPDGNYVVRIEASKEFDQNGSYAFPSPTLVTFGEYGLAYRGQPSVVWSVPIALDASPHDATTLDYEGYGDPAGADGVLRSPDDTITTDTEGSGAQRLLLATTIGGASYRVHVSAVPSDGAAPLGAPSDVTTDVATNGTAELLFTEPTGTISGYEVRISAGTPLTADNFSTGQLVSTASVKPAGAGTVQNLHLTGLQGSTHYYVGVRAQDACLQGGALATAELTTVAAQNGEVSACFIATAAFGSPMVAEVSLLRRFRDQILKRQALGEVFVETYYTFGPALAGVIRPSDTLRSVARAALAPIIDRARALLE